METSELVKELKNLLNKYPNWDKQEIEKARVLASKLQRECSDAIYNMEIMDDFNYMHHIMTGD